jgi:translation machinery-associated protein 16
LALEIAVVLLCCVALDVADASTRETVAFDKLSNPGGENVPGVSGERPLLLGAATPPIICAISIFFPDESSLISQIILNTNHRNNSLVKMPKALHKVQKHISGKKGHNTALHANSRDAHALLRASARSSRIDKANTQRRRARSAMCTSSFFTLIQMLTSESVGRVLHFKSVAAQADDEPLSVDDMHREITSYIARDAPELLLLQQSRRPSRPPNKREYEIREQASTETAEYEAGFWMPDLRDVANLQALTEWNRYWVSLNTVKFVRVTRNSEDVAPSTWPPNGDS